MHKYVALLRGISPTNPNMKNEKLRALFSSLGFKDVQTVISSGNVLFRSGIKDYKKLEALIEEALPKKLGFNSTTIIISQERLKRLVEKDPFKGIDDTPKSRLNVTFVKSKAKAPFTLPYTSKDKSYCVIGMKDQAVFTKIDLSGTKTPGVMLWLQQQFGKEITTRTWKTVNRIMSKLSN